MSLVKDHPTQTLGALDATAAVTTEDADEISISVTGTWVGTITFQVTNDNENWFDITLHHSEDADKKAATKTTTSNGLFYHPTGAFKQVRSRMTSYTSGTATIKYVTTRFGV